MLTSGTSARWFPANAANKMESMEKIVRDRLEAIHSLAPGSIGDQMGYELLDCDEAAGEYTLLCQTFPWMRNIPGTLHGGMCATVVDQAMGFIAHCVKRGNGTAPTVELQVSYHRPLNPGEDVIVKVKVVSVTRSLMRLSSEAYQAGKPEKVCLTATATYFNKTA